jgi:hypothetical protein
MPFEDGTAPDATTYFEFRALGKNAAFCAWNQTGQQDRRTVLAVGDPFVRR